MPPCVPLGMAEAPAGWRQGGVRQPGAVRGTTTHAPMIVTKLPMALAVVGSSSNLPLPHWVVTATVASSSYISFLACCQGKAGAVGGDGGERVESRATHRPRFRIDHLSAHELAHMLQHSRSVTEPLKAYNFSSPGDLGLMVHPAPCESSRAAVQRQEPVVNCAYLHIVERAGGDFVPNNMLYHQLQKFTVGSLGSVSAFEEFLAQAQGGSTVPPGPGARGDASCGAEYRHVVSRGEMERKFREDPGNAAGSQCASCAPLQLPGACNGPQDIVVKSMHNLTVTAETVVGRQTFFFYPFPVDVACGVPFLSSCFVVLVNLKPIVPGHLMVVPRRCVSTIHGLTVDEVAEWGEVMRLTLDVLAAWGVKHQLGGATGSGSDMWSYSIAIQQGSEAGQTVPHLHTHVIPFNPNGKLAGEPEPEEQEQRTRAPRTAAEMQVETNEFKLLFEEVLARCPVRGTSCP